MGFPFDDSVSRDPLVRQVLRLRVGDRLPVVAVALAVSVALALALAEAPVGWDVAPAVAVSAGSSGRRSFIT